MGSNVEIKWDHKEFLKSTTEKAMNGAERCALTVMKPQALSDCPVAPEFGGTLRDSIGVERDDKKLQVVLGCGGAAAAYAAKQEKDRTLNHTTGKAGFIRDSVQMHSDKLPQYVQEDILK